VAASLLDVEFSLSELQQVYEAVQGRELDKRNFRKWVLGSSLVEPTAHYRREGAHRPARLYRFVQREAA
jgi:8-oxo-dGTP diphosphatase